MHKRVLLLLAAFSLIAAACGSTAEDAPFELNLSQSDLGQILSDAGGNTIYLFGEDTQGVPGSECVEGCLIIWPVVGEVDSLSPDLDASLVGSFERGDGAMQATYNGWPLYTFAVGEIGETLGQGIDGEWWVMDAAGNAVTTSR